MEQLQLQVCIKSNIVKQYVLINFLKGFSLEKDDVADLLSANGLNINKKHVDGLEINKKHVDELKINKKHVDGLKINKKHVDGLQINKKPLHTNFKAMLAFLYCSHFNLYRA